MTSVLMGNVAGGISSYAYSTISSHAQARVVQFVLRMLHLRSAGTVVGQSFRWLFEKVGGMSQFLASGVLSESQRSKLTGFFNTIPGSQWLRKNFGGLVEEITRDTIDMGINQMVRGVTTQQVDVWGQYLRSGRTEEDMTRALEETQEQLVQPVQRAFVSTVDTLFGEGTAESAIQQGYAGLGGGRLSQEAIERMNQSELRGRLTNATDPEEKRALRQELLERQQKIVDQKREKREERIEALIEGETVQITDPQTGSQIRVSKDAAAQMVDVVMEDTRAMETEIRETQERLGQLQSTNLLEEETELDRSLRIMEAEAQIQGLDKQLSAIRQSQQQAEALAGTLGRVTRDVKIEAQLGHVLTFMGRWAGWGGGRLYEYVRGPGARALEAQGATVQNLKPLYEKVYQTITQETEIRTRAGAYVGEVSRRVASWEQVLASVQDPGDLGQVVEQMSKVADKASLSLGLGGSVMATLSHDLDNLSGGVTKFAGQQALNQAVGMGMELAGGTVAGVASQALFWASSNRALLKVGANTAEMTSEWVPREGSVQDVALDAIGVMGTVTNWFVDNVIPDIPQLKSDYLGIPMVDVGKVVQAAAVTKALNPSKSTAEIAAQAANHLLHGTHRSGRAISEKDKTAIQQALEVGLENVFMGLG